MAHKLAVHFHGKMGAPRMNHNRRMGELKKEMYRIIAGDC
jgi:hypothetical protein